MTTPRDRFEALLAPEISHLRRYARTLTRDTAHADDLVQDCLERALRKWHRWQMQGPLRSWLFRILYRLYLNHLRSGHYRRGERSLDTLAIEPAQMDRQQGYAECVDIINAMRWIAADQREAILRVALDDLSYDEAAGSLGIPVGTVRSRISRGRTQLRLLCGENRDSRHAGALAQAG